MSPDAYIPRRSHDRFWPLALAGLCVIAGLAVFLLNGGPLFYFDTVGYVEQGTSVLRMVVPHDWLVHGATAGPGGGGPAAPDDKTVNGSRSAIFSVFLAVLYHAHLFRAFPVVGAAFVLAAIWLPMRVALRRSEGVPPLWMVLLLPLLAACAGSLPFYLAFLMPDIFAAVLILVCASLVAFGPEMRRWEVLVSVALGLASVLAHPSHLLIVAVMVPVCFVLALLGGRRGWWIAPLMVLAMLLGGAGERLLFRSAVEVATKSEVTYFPFLTARIIADGPGLAYLETHCPDPAIPTCLLHAALSQSDDPMRLTATHIVFATSPEIGSFRRMALEDQKRVVQDQRNFVREVVLTDPVGVLSSLVRNTANQADMNSVEMTVPSPGVAASVSEDLPAADLGAGRLIADREAWLPQVETAHRVIYLLSLALIGLLVLWPNRLMWQLRLFAAAILLGIVANAFICGAVSQPANRYGARVIWLLPMLAAMLAVFAWPRHQDKGAGR